MIKKSYNTHYHTGEAAILGNPFVTGKLYPISAEAPHYVIDSLTFETEIVRDEPVPPVHLRENYGSDGRAYLESGRHYARTIAAMMPKATDQGLKILDWGCAAGRVLRFLPNELGASECWGCDINMQHILWAQTHLGMDLGFVQCTTAPHLTFPDNKFDFIYALSVFTHISEIPEMWFAELNRILKPGGFLFATIHDEDSVRHLMNTKENELGYWLKQLIQPLVASGDLNLETFLRFSVGNRTPAGVQMFYRRNHLLHCIRGLFVLEEARHQTFGEDYQTGLLLRKV